MAVQQEIPCPGPATAPRVPRYCEVRLKRARDLTDEDVINHNGRWREVLAVYRREDDIYAEWGLPGAAAPGAPEDQLPERVREAFDRILDTYVILRIWLHEESPAEVEDELVTVYRNELFEVQTLPANVP
jgi:hypothetical protein